MTKNASEVYSATVVRGIEPCNAFLGVATAIDSFNGVPVIVMARTRDELARVVTEINPRITYNPDLAIPAAIVPERAISKEDDL